MLKHRWRILMASILIFIAPLIWADDEAWLTDLAVTPPSKSSPNTKIMLNLNHPVGYKFFTLSNPSRLVVDLQKTQYVFSGGKRVNLLGTDVTDFRHGIQQGYNLRIVFDLKFPMNFSIETNHGKDKDKDKVFQIILTLSPLSAVHNVALPSPVQHLIESDIKNDIKAEKTEKPPVTETLGKTVEAKITETKTVEKKITPKESTPIMPPPKKHTFIVVIDAGHGGNDPGAEGHQDTKEKNVTIAIAKDLQALVNEQTDMKAVMTRKSDYYVGLRQRLMIARRAKGDIFVAIHADAFDDETATGASVFALSLHGASSEAARWLAQKENYSELGGIDLNGIQDKDAQVRSVLIDLSQTATISASLQLGQNVIQQLGKITDLHHGVVEQAPFMVLKSPDIPSILVETGFISNPKEESRLKTSEYQEKIAQALMEGINAYYRKNVQKTFSPVVSAK